MNHLQAAEKVESVQGFVNDLRAHLAPGGVVFSCPAFLVMFRPVPRSASVEALVNPWMRWDERECDCWFIWLLVGDGRAALDALVPLFGPKKWVAFQTRGLPKFWEFEKLHSQYGKRIVKQQSSNQAAKGITEGIASILGSNGKPV
jgi:hypothetical protein